MMRFLFFGLMALLTVVSNAGGFESIYLNDSGDDSFIRERSSRVWNFTSVKPGGRIVLEFESRIDFPNLGGWAPCIQIEVNNIVVAGMATRTEKRLLNKELATPGHIDYGVFKACVDDKFYALYAPDFEQAKNRFAARNEEAHRIKLDISDLVSETSENQLRIRFGADLKGYYRGLGINDREPALVIHNLKILSEDEPSRLQKKPTAAAGYVKMAKKEPVKFKALQDKSGAIIISAGGRDIAVESCYSVPGGSFNKWDSFNTSENGISASNRVYSLNRRLVLRENRVDVFDELKSNSDTLIGLRLRYQTGDNEFDTVYLAGDPSPMFTKKEGGRNPSVFLSGKNGKFGIGIVAVDDVFRVQNIHYCQNGAAGIGSDTFALSPGESRVVEYSIYPINSGDYFDFVNEVRNDWDVNFPMEGGFHLSMGMYKSWNKKSAEEFAGRLGLTMQSFGVLFWQTLGGEYSKRSGSVHGFGLMLDEIRQGNDDSKTYSTEPMRKFVRDALAKCKEYTPSLKRMIYVHNQYSQEPNDKEKYAACAVTDTSGKALSTQGGSYRFFIPTKENEFGKKNLAFIKYLLDNYDLDGIYHDEFNYTHKRITYSMWDNVSVELDERNEVVRKIGYVPLLKLGYSLELMRYVIRERGKCLVANFSPETRSELKYHFPRFEETYYASWIFLSHLYSPIQLGDMLIYSNTPSDCMEDIRNAIRKGALYYHYVSSTPSPTITAKMYPFTPVELHAGYLVGKERIITVLSGEYGIPGEEFLYDVFVYDQNGKLQENYPYEHIKNPDGVKCRINLEKDYCAALVKKRERME